jgi:trk system potassium uptake protein TrkH
MGVREMRAAGLIGPTLLLGMTLAGSFLSLTVGGLAAGRILRMPQTAAQIAWAAGTALLLSTLGGGAALAAGGRNVFEALFHATCAFGNSALWLGPLPGTTDGATYLVLLPLVILGGLGLPVLIEICDRLFGGPPLSRHSRLVLKLAAGMYLAGFVALVLAQVPAAWAGGAVAWRNTIASCSVAAINTRSAGLPFQSPAAFTIAGQWLLMALMLIGAAPAGTASGLKTTTLWQLARGVRDVLRGRPVPRPVGIAAVWLIAFVVVLFAGILLMATIEPQIAPDRLLFLCCSAIANVGLSHDPVSITGPGLLVLSALMLAGRLGPLAVLWWMAETTSGADVLVG